MPRLFFGLEIPPEIKDRLIKIRSAVPGAKWQRAEQLHITLLFLGSVEEEQVTAVCNSASEIQIEPFSLQVAGLGCFGQPRFALFESQLSPAGSEYRVFERFPLLTPV